MLDVHVECSEVLWVELDAVEDCIKSDNTISTTGLFFRA